MELFTTLSISTQTGQVISNLVLSSLIVNNLQIKLL